MSAKTNDITTISFSSGGVKATGHMGVLMHLIDSGVTANVKSWYGCSAGSVHAFIGALGVSSTWIKDCCRLFDTRLLFKTEAALVMDFMNVWGVTSGKELVETVGTFIDTWEPGASTWTFADLKRERGMFLGITATNLSRRELTLFSVDTHPTMKIMDAIRASSSIPFVYTPWIDSRGDVYVDGAMIEQCPWFHIQQKKETLVVACSRSQIFGPMKEGLTIETFFEYCSRIVVLQRTRLTRERPTQWIAVENETVATLNFDATLEDRICLLEDGIAAAITWTSSRTQGSRPLSEDRHTSSLTRPTSEEVTSDSRQSQIPLPSLAPSQGRREHTGRSFRRWSV